LDGGRLLERVNFTIDIAVNGARVGIPVIGGLGTEHLNEAELWLNRTLDVLLKSSRGAFVDVGVNLGQTLLKVKTLRPDVPYVGFEPNPTCVTYVRRLIAANGWSSCTLAPVGLSDRSDVLSLFSRDAVDSSATVVKGFRLGQDEWSESPVTVIPGDQALASLRIGPIGIIKIDVEGAELEVVRGLEATLREHHPYVLCEVLPIFGENDPRWAFRKPRQDEFLGLMHGAGYTLFRLLENGGAVRLDTIEPHGSRALTNYAFVPFDAAPAFARAFGVSDAIVCASAVAEKVG
jgi:FkbM family methyltransferase